MFVSMSVKEYVEKLSKRLEELQNYDEDEPIMVREDVGFIDNAIQDLIYGVGGMEDNLADPEKTVETIENNLICKKLFMDLLAEYWNDYENHMENATQDCDFYSDLRQDLLYPFFEQHKEQLGYVSETDDEEDEDGN